MIIQHGLTVCDIYDKNLEAKLKLLKNRPWARLVIDDTTKDFIDAAEMISYYADVRVQLLDSFDDAKTNTSQYSFREGWFFSGLRDYPIEIANEPNGSWNGPFVVSRMQTSSQYFTGRKQMVTLYYQPGVVDWWNKNKVDGVEVWLSFYPEQLSDFKDVLTTLIKLDAVGLGECGMEEFSRGRKELQTRNVMEAAKALGVSVNWWDWQKDHELWGEVFDV